MVLPLNKSTKNKIAGKASTCQGSKLHAKNSQTNILLPISRNNSASLPVDRIYKKDMTISVVLE
jgi:hypothetical protein